MVLQIEKERAKRSKGEGEKQRAWNGGAGMWLYKWSIDRRRRRCSQQTLSSPRASSSKRNHIVKHTYKLLNYDGAQLPSLPMSHNRIYVDNLMSFALLLFPIHSLTHYLSRSSALALSYFGSLSLFLHLKYICLIPLRRSYSHSPRTFFCH